MLTKVTLNFKTHLVLKSLLEILTKITDKIKIQFSLIIAPTPRNPQNLVLVIGLVIGLAMEKYKGQPKQYIYIYT